MPGRRITVGQLQMEQSMLKKALVASPPTLYDDTFVNENQKLSNVDKVQRISISDTATPISPKMYDTNGSTSEMGEAQPVIKSPNAASTQVNMTFVMPPQPDQINIQINKFTKLSRNQGALKPETHDFLLQLVKRSKEISGESRNNGNPVIHYTNCFNNVPGILQRLTRQPSNCATTLGTKALSPGHWTSSQKQLVDKKLRKRTKKRLVTKHSKNTQPLVSLSSEQDCTMSASGTGPTMQKSLQRISIGREEDLCIGEVIATDMTISTQKSKGSGGGPSMRPTLDQIGPQQIRVPTIPPSPIKNIVQGRIEPPKKNFQLRAKEQFIAAQIASMAVTGEHQVASRPALHQPIEPVLQHVRKQHISQPKLHQWSKNGPGFLDIHITTPHKANMLDCTQTNDFQIQQHTQRLFETECVKEDDEEVIVDQEKFACKCKASCTCINNEREQTPKHFLTDLISKKTMDQLHTKSSLSKQKLRHESGLDIAISITQTGKANEETRKISRLNLEIDPDLPMSSQSNTHNKSESTVRTPVITQKSQNSQNPSLRVHMLQQQSNAYTTQKEFATHGIIHNFNIGVAQKTQGAGIIGESIIKRKPIQPQQTTASKKDEKKKKSSNVWKQNAARSSLGSHHDEPQFRVNSIPDRVVNKDLYFEHHTRVSKFDQNAAIRLDNDSRSLIKVYRSVDGEPKQVTSPTAPQHKDQQQDSRARIPAKPLQLAKFSPMRQISNVETLVNQSPASPQVATTVNIIQMVSNNQFDVITHNQHQKPRQASQNLLKNQPIQVGIKAGGNQQVIKPRKIKAKRQMTRKGHRMNNNESEISSTHSKDVETVKNYQSSCEYLLEDVGGRMDSSVDLFNRSPQPESPAPMSPLKSRFNGITPFGTQYNQRKMQMKSQEQEQMQEFRALKESKSQRKGVRKRVASKLSLKSSTINPSTIISIGSLEQSTIGQVTKHRGGSEPPTINFNNSEEIETTINVSNKRGPKIVEQTLTDHEFTLSPGATMLEQARNMFPSIETLATMQASKPQPTQSQANTFCLASIPELVGTPTAIASGQMTGTVTPQLTQCFEEENQHQMILSNLQNDLQLVSEVSRSSEESIPISPSLGKFLQAKLREQCCSSAASRSPAISSHQGGGNSALMHVVNEREYQANCERLIEANTNLQDAINISRRTPLTPATMTAGLPCTNAHSSCFSFYRFDDALYKRAAGFVPSRESGRDGSYSFAKLRLGDTFMGTGLSVSSQQAQRMRLPQQQATPKYAINRQDGGGVLVMSSEKSRIQAVEATDDQVLDNFIEQLDLESGNEEARVQNISDYLNIRRADPLLLFPNLQLENEPLPGSQIAAVYRIPKAITKTNLCPYPIALEKFQF